MAAETKNKPQSTGPTTGPTGFGAYAAGTSMHGDLTLALDKEPEAKRNGSLAFTDSDKRWLKELGLTTTDPHSFHHNWRTEGEKYRMEHHKWSESYKGRVAIRSVSRFVVGAAFYAAANMYAGKTLPGYNLEKTPEGFLQHVARAIDLTAGKGIKWTVNHLGGDGLNAVRFRDKVDYGYKWGKGRSLGHEATMITFDFAAMSFGDYMTRYFIGLMDPNAKAHWMKDGHLDVPGGLKDLFKNIFRGITYAAGEDMAVAIPYVYGMRLQRNIINHYSPGFNYSSDMGRNGGDYKTPDGKITGDYQLEGMLDLMGRFSWYNVGTKMFRDAYNKVAEKADDWWNGDRKLHMPTIDTQKLTPSNLATSAAHGVRYVVRTTLKVMGYMIPATVFFFITRTPQSKVRGVAIDPKKGIIGRFIDKDKNPIDRAALVGEEIGQEGIKFRAVKPGSWRAADFSAAKNESISGLHALTYSDATGVAAPYPFTASRTDAFTNKFYETVPFYDKFFRPFGQVCYDFGTVVHKGAGKAINSINRVGSKVGVHFSPDAKSLETFARTYANAAIAYTPYFMMKTDILSAEWDTKRMDMAIDRTLDGIGHLKWSEIKAGASEVMRATMREPFTDPKREEVAQRMVWRADPEHRSNEAFQLNGIGKRFDSNQEETGEKKFAVDALKPKSIAPATFAQLKPREDWATQEAVRKFTETDPQGQSFH